MLGVRYLMDIMMWPLKVLNEESRWDYKYPGSKLRSSLAMTYWMLLSCLYLVRVKMLRSQRHSLTLAVIMSWHIVCQRSRDVRVKPGESWIHWIMGVMLSVPMQEGGSLSL